MSFLSKKMYFFIIFLFSFSQCDAQVDKKITLGELYKKYSLNGSERNARNFFYAFPNSFNQFQKLYGYDELKGASPYYEIAADHISLFYNISKYIDKETFATKLIKISKEGKWDADAVNYFQEGLRSYFLKGDNNLLASLHKNTNAEIISFWFFYLDGPHFNKDIYKRTLLSLKKDTLILGLYEQVAKKRK